MLTVASPAMGSCQLKSQAPPDPWHNPSFRSFRTYPFEAHSGAVNELTQAALGTRTNNTIPERYGEPLSIQKILIGKKGVDNVDQSSRI